jgi:hypothetical protein
MVKIIITETQLNRFFKNLIKEETEGESEFIKILEDRYDLSEELKSEIINTFKLGECKNVKFQKIKMGDGLALGNRLILNPSILNYSLGRALFILFHEMAHQYQFKKYGKEKMMELYEDHISILDAAKFMYDTEKVADEFAVRKLKSLERKGLVTLEKSDTRKGYEYATIPMLERIISQFRNELRVNNVSGHDQVSEFLYNMVKMDQINDVDGKSYRKDLNTKSGDDDLIGRG